MGILTKMANSRAIKKIARRLPAFLASSYGYAEVYTPGQVSTAVESTDCNPDFIDHAYAMFCSEEDFGEVCSADYGNLHQEVADVCFNGNNNFEIHDLTSYSSDAGGGDVGGGDGGGGGD